MTLASNKSDGSNSLLPLDGLKSIENSNTITTENDLGQNTKGTKPDLHVADMIEERSEQDADDTLDNIKKTDLQTEEEKKSSTLKQTQGAAD